MEPDSLTFTPEQASQLTGVSPDRQRNWRKDGFIPSRAGKGWTRYSIEDLCRLFLLNACVSTNIGLSRAKLGVDHLVPLLAEKVSLGLLGKHAEAGKVEGTVVFWGTVTGPIGLYRGLQHAFSEETADLQASGAPTIIDLQSLGTAFAIKVRKHLESVGEVEK
jgi:hypothetical protein